MTKVIFIAALCGVVMTVPAAAQGRTGAADGTTAIRCELRTVRAPDAAQVLYFYVSDARRTVLETDGNALGNVVQFSAQRIVVTKNAPEGGVRTYVWDRMLGSLAISTPSAPGAKDSWNSLSGDCVKVSAAQQKF